MGCADRLSNQDACMPHYFFDIHDGFDLRDDVGRDLENVEEVRSEALKVIAGLAAAEGEDSDGYAIVLNVRDESGDSALSVRMVCQVDDRSKPQLKLVS